MSLDEEDTVDDLLAMSANDPVDVESVMEDAVGQIILGKENLDGERKPTKATPLNGEEFRRSVYIQVRRSRTLSMFETFDAPTMSPNCDRRSFSTVTPQSLLMMNSDFSIEYSNKMAQRVIDDVGEDVPLQIALAWQLTFAKPSSAEELAEASSFVYAQRTLIAKADQKLKAEDVAREALLAVAARELRLELVDLLHAHIAPLAHLG